MQDNQKTNEQIFNLFQELNQKLDYTNKKLDNLYEKVDNIETRIIICEALLK